MQKRQQQIDLISFESSRSGDLGSMSGKFVEGKSRQKKLQIGQEENTPRDGSGEVFCRILSQPAARSDLICQRHLARIMPQRLFGHAGPWNLPMPA
jgi:hypothetical protein